MYEIKRTDKEIDDLLNQCMDSADTGHVKYPGMTYEQGIQAALDWVTDNSDVGHPLNE